MMHGSGIHIPGESHGEECADFEVHSDVWNKYYKFSADSGMEK